eukprot:9484782-Pyramimonas_sp.AAC.1
MIRPWTRARKSAAIPRPHVAANTSWTRWTPSQPNHAGLREQLRTKDCLPRPGKDGRRVLHAHFGQHKHTDVELDGGH